MSAEVRLLQEEQSVLVRSEGAVSIADFQAVRAHVAEVLRERRWRRVLFDGREVERPVTLIEAYGLTASLSGAFPSGTRIAVLVSNETEIDLKFLEESARETYGLSFKTFHVYADALKWLLSLKTVRQNISRPFVF